jgi:glycosyltransferase involved in cell wall biosynthesis
MLVSVITPTYDRSQFIPQLIEDFKQQTYDHSKIEWIILDDAPPEKRVGHFFDLEVDFTVRYIESETKQPMGAKLNRLNSEATGDIIIVMDDDDYYPPTRIQTVVDAFDQHPRKEIAGCSKVYMCNVASGEILVAGPYHDKHALNCTLAYKRSYLENHQYDDKEPCAVERVFTNDFTEPMIQLDSKATILHRIHDNNTFKNKMGAGLLRKTELTIENFVKVK